MEPSESPLRWTDRGQTPLSPEVLVALLTQATRKDPERSETHYRLGRALCQQGRFAPALDALEKAASLRPQDAATWLAMGQTLMDLNRPEDGLTALDRAVELTPDGDAAHALRGMALKALGRSDPAKQALDRALELSPRSTVPARERMRFFFEERDREGLRAWCERRIEAGGGTASVLSGWLLSLKSTPEDQKTATKLMDYERFLAQERLDSEEWESLHPTLIAEIMNHPDLRRVEASHATRNGSRIESLLTSKSLATADLVQRIRRSVERYVERLPEDSGHPFLQTRPTAARLNVWSIILTEDGYEEPHIHSDAWLSGVYYVAVPDSVRHAEDHRGSLKFGPPSDDDFSEGRGWPIRYVRPQPGLLLLFPSYFYHRTIPTGVSQERISVAFDVIAEA